MLLHLAPLVSQDLSVAGLRKGLKHEENGDDETTRSGLFMEAIRIIKEMREATGGEFPRFALWENVPGAFSSSKGEDFRVVLEEFIKIVEPEAPALSVPEKGWPYAGIIMGSGWSLAYRVLDAQYIRTAQRRRRIYLVFDLRGQRAGKILFERESLRRDPPQSGTPRKRTAGGAEECPGTDDSEGETTNVINLNDAVGADIYNLNTTGDVVCSLTANGYNSTGTSPKVLIPCTLEPGIAAREGGHIYEGVSGTLRSEAGDNRMAVAYGISSHESNYTKTGESYVTAIGVDLYNQALTGDVSKAMTSSASDADHVPCTIVCGPVHSQCFDARGNGDGTTVPTLTGDHENRVTDYTALVCSSPCYCLQGNGIDQADTAGCNGRGWTEGVSYTLNTIDRPAVAYTMQAFRLYSDCDVASGLKARDYKDATDLVVDSHAYGVDCRNISELPDLYPTLQAKPNGGQSLNYSGALRQEYIVRRLTPTECARLQNFPDGWAHPDQKTELTDEEYQFWLNVRNTHAAINGKAVKQYTREQMLRWYNGLHTDSAEYKLWGNGIALPCALYVMEGIAEELEKEKSK